MTTEDGNTRSSLRYKAAMGVKILLLSWPIAHMILSLFFGVNSWKFAGWGMYASHHTSQKGVTLLWTDDPQLPVESVGELLGGVRLSSVKGTSVVEVQYWKIPSPALARIADLGRKFLVVQWQRHLQELVETAGREAFGDPEEYVLALVSQPRLSLFGKRAYTTSDVYVVHRGEVSYLGDFSSREMTEAAILSTIRERFARAVTE